MTNEERIKVDAEAATNDHANTLRTYTMEYPRMIARLFGYKEGYIAGATAENDRSKVLVDALEEFISYHETGLLPARHVYEKAVAAREQWKSGKGKEQPAKPIEYMPVHPEDARKFDCPKQFPMHLLNEDQAMRNHGQTLKRLKERGGLSVHEILAIVDRKPWNHYGAMSWTEAIKKLNDIVIINPQQSK